MKFSTPILAGLLSISSMAAGHIVAFALPKQLGPGQNFAARLIDDGNMSREHDIFVTFGAVPAEYARKDMLGAAFLGQKTLYHRSIGKLPTPGHNISVPLYVPASFPKGKTVVTGALFSVQHTDDSNYSPSISYLTATVDVTNGMHLMGARSLMEDRDDKDDRDDRDDRDDDEDDDDDDDKDDDE